MIISRKKTHPVIYEINTQVWIKRFSKNGKSVQIKDIPDTYWQGLAEKGIDFVWLMGIWQTNESACEKYCFTKDLMLEYSRSLPDWKKADVIGSPYAIDSYTVHKKLGTDEDIVALKKRLHKLGLKLILDFVPNHFSACTRYLHQVPELFISGGVENLTHRPDVFFTRDDDGYIFAHGRDPYFDPWQDTVQVNIFHQKTRDFLMKTLIDMTLLCDGVRCDMAMLLLNDIFYNTWAPILEKKDFRKPEKEFWDVAIQCVRKVESNFIFIAEAYWDTGWRLQQMGFNFTYDKELYDRLRYGSAHHIRSHLLAEEGYQRKSVRFIENHDEGRAVSLIGNEKSKAAAVVISTIQGLSFFYDGQFEGRKIKHPVQLGREGKETIHKDFIQFYRILLRIRQSRTLQSGTWRLIQPNQTRDGNTTHTNFLVWVWINNNSHLLVIINYSHIKSQCRLRLTVPETIPFIIFNDLLGGVSYKMKTKELLTHGLYIDREGYQSHIFYYKTE